MSGVKDKKELENKEKNIPKKCIGIKSNKDCQKIATKDNLCLPCYLKHELKCYQISVAPILFKYYYDKDEKLRIKTKQLVGKWYIWDRIVNYIGEKGIKTSPQKILDYIETLEKEYQN